MMAKLSLKFKKIVSSKFLDNKSIEKLRDLVLGCHSDPKRNLIGIKFYFNSSKRRKGVKIKPNLTNRYLNEFQEICLSHRSLLSVCNRIYDPLGLAAPYTIKLNQKLKKV